MRTITERYNSQRHAPSTRSINKSHRIILNKTTKTNYIASLNRQNKYSPKMRRR